LLEFFLPRLHTLLPTSISLSCVVFFGFAAALLFLGGRLCADFLDPVLAHLLRPL
jgi:hypothetical protein